MTVAIPCLSILIKFSQIAAKRLKQKVTKFGSHSLSGFRVAADILVVWDKNPTPIGNRVKGLQAQPPPPSCNRVKRYDIVQKERQVKCTYGFNRDNFQKPLKMKP